MHHNIHRDEVVVNACEWIGWNPIWSLKLYVHAFLKEQGDREAEINNVFLSVNYNYEKIGDRKYKSVRLFLKMKKQLTFSEENETNNLYNSAPRIGCITGLHRQDAYTISKL